MERKSKFFARPEASLEPGRAFPLECLPLYFSGCHQTEKSNWQYFRNFANTVAKLTLWEHVLILTYELFCWFCLVLWEFCMCLYHIYLLLEVLPDLLLQLINQLSVLFFFLHTQNPGRRLVNIKAHFYLLNLFVKLDRQS